MDMQDVSNLVIPEGEVRTIHDEENRLLWGRLNYNTRYMGNVIQDGVPTPDSPQNVNVVTGTQTISITDGIDSHSYTVNLGSTELCKIGTYQDYIYKSGSDWYVHKAIGKTVLDGSEDWFKSGTSAIDRFGVPNTYFGGVTSMSSSTTISDHFVYNSGAIYGTYHISGANVYFDYTPNGTTTKNQWVAWLSSNHTTVYYVVGTPTDTKITDATLIAQLDAVHQFLTRYGYNGTVSGNLPIIIDKTNL